MLYSIKQLRELEKESFVREKRIEKTLVFLSLLDVFCFFFIFLNLLQDDIVSALTNTALFLVLLLFIYFYKKRKNHIVLTIILSYIVCCIIFVYFFIKKSFCNISISSFWIWVLVIPYVSIHISGILYGLIASSSGLIMSIAFMLCKIYIGQNNIAGAYPALYIFIQILATIIENNFTKYYMEKIRIKKESEFIKKHVEENIEEYSVDYNFLRKFNEIYEQKMKRFMNTVENYIQNDEIDVAYNFLCEIYNEKKTDISLVEKYADNEYVNFIIESYLYRLKGLCNKINIKCEAIKNIEKRCNINKLIEFLSISFEMLENEIKYLSDNKSGLESEENSTLKKGSNCNHGLNEVIDGLDALKVWLDIEIDKNFIKIRKVGIKFKLGSNYPFSSVNFCVNKKGKLEAYRDGEDFIKNIVSNEGKLEYLYKTGIIPFDNYEILQKIYKYFIKYNGKYDVIKTKNSFYTELVMPLKSCKD